MLLISLALLILPVLLRVIEVSSKEEILAKPQAFVYFYAPDCKYCNAFNDDFEYISHIYNHDQQFHAVKINGRKHGDLVNLFGVTSFPSLKFYDNSKKRVTTFQKQRLAQNVEAFIGELSQVTPNYSAIKMGFAEVNSVDDVETLLALDRPVLIAFVNSESSEWKSFHYPSHYFQQSARAHPEIAFAVKFIDQGDSKLMEKYHVSNAPSVVLLADGQIGIHNTLSTNQMINYILDSETIDAVIGSMAEKPEGVWFGSESGLAEYASSLEFEGHKQKKYGMNYVESRANGDGMTIEEQYQMLLDSVGL